MLIRRVRRSFDLTRLPIGKTDVFLLTLLEDPLTLDQLLQIAPGDCQHIRERIDALAVLGVVELVPELRAFHPDDAVTLRPPPRAEVEPVTLRPPPDARSFDDAVTLRPPPGATNPFGVDAADTPSTGVRVRPRRAAPSPFVIPRSRRSAG